MEGRPPTKRQNQGSPEFIASYNEAAAQKLKTPSGWLLSLLQRYQQSDDFRSLGESARERITLESFQKVIEPEFSDFPLSALQDKRTRGIFLDWRDRLALKSRRQADYAWTVLALVLSWSKDRGQIDVNPCERGGRLYRGSRAEKIWTEDGEARFLKTAPAHLHLPLTLALWTGQRQGDLLRLPWSAYDGTHIRLRQSKGKVRVVIPVGAPLKGALDTAVKRSTIILTTTEGNPWTPDGFRTSWRKACKRAGIVGVTFNDLRGTAVTLDRRSPGVRRQRLRRSPVTACVTCAQSWTRTTFTVIRRLPRARSGSSKGEQNLPNELPNGLRCSGLIRRKVNLINGWGTRIRT